MRVMMLGWEFPPFVSGGLGTACHGLTKALAKQHVQILFVLPKPIETTAATHVRLLTPPVAPSQAWSFPAQEIEQHVHTTHGGQVVHQSRIVNDANNSSHAVALPDSDEAQSVISHHVRLTGVDARLPGAYGSGQTAMNRPRLGKIVKRIDPVTGRVIYTREDQQPSESLSILRYNGKAGETYDGDLIQESRRYAQLCVQLATQHEFDVVHAHDWMTFPAGMAVAAATGKPLVVHVHSTEFDRAGDHIHQQVYDIERRGVKTACKVIAVSHLTRSILQHRYGIDGSKIEVVYNGIEPADHGGRDVFNSQAAISRKDKIVLFLGRITMQKGPEYFIAAAKKVLEKIDHVKFVIAGTGDKIRDIIELAASEGIGHKVLFTGFLHKEDVQRVFRMADVYVMPSVSEPFGIAPLEAISHDVPVIISKTSGVSEVLTHALKVDFWDTHEMANKIIAVLRYPPLSTTLRQHADLEIRRLTWQGAATRCQEVYGQAMAMMPE